MIIKNTCNLLLHITTKRVFFVLAIFHICVGGLFAQFNLNNNKLQISIQANFGAVVSLPKHNNSILFVPASLSQYYGLLVNGKYKRINLETGLQNFASPAIMAVKDDIFLLKDSPSNSSYTAAFNNVNTAYYRIPLSIGYDIGFKNSHFAFEPNLSLGMLFSTSAYSNLSSGSNGGLVSSTDTITTSFTHGLQRTQKSVFYAGIGAKLKYKYKKIVASINIDFFQTFGAWTTSYGVYNRSSLVHGSLFEQQSFRSVDRNIIFGITVGRYFRE